MREYTNLRCSVLAAACLMLLGADVDDFSDESATQTVVKSSPLDLLQGDWKVVVLNASIKEPLGEVFTFRGAQLQWRKPDANKPHVQFDLKLGQADELATFDLSRNVTGKQITGLGVYRLEGDTLEMHYGWGNQRPPSLERPSGGFTFKLKRVR